MPACDPFLDDLCFLVDCTLMEQMRETRRESVNLLYSRWGWLGFRRTTRLEFIYPLSLLQTPNSPSDSPTSPQPGRTCRSVPLLPSPPQLHLLTSTLLRWGWQDARRQEIEAKRQRLVDLRRAREERRALLESERTGSTAASDANVRIFSFSCSCQEGAGRGSRFELTLALTFPLTPPKASSRLPSSSIKEGRSRLPSQFAPWSNTFLAIPSGVKPELDGC